MDQEKIGIAAMARLAQQGNVEAARDVLSEFADRVEQARLTAKPEETWGDSIPWALADYLATCFRAILKGKDGPAKALNLTARRRGRVKGRTRTLDLEALSASYFLLRRAGMTPERINAELAAEIGADRSTVYRARTSFPFGNRKRFDDEVLKVCLKPYSKQIAAILKRRKK